MSQVEITKVGNELHVESPYHPDLPRQARKLGGDWRKPVWVFDARNEAEVRALYRDVYGTDGSSEDKTVTVEIKFSSEEAYCGDKSLFFAGRQIVRIFDRDSGAKLGDGVTVLEGGFSSGGSRKNPCLTREVGTKIRIFDIVEALVDEIRSVDGVESVSIAPPKPELASAPADSEVDATALAEERLKLVARLKEIDALLAPAPAEKTDGAVPIESAFGKPTSC
jgi:hypothetical protein